MAWCHRLLLQVPALLSAKGRFYLLVLSANMLTDTPSLCCLFNSFLDCFVTAF